MMRTMKLVDLRTAGFTSKATSRSVTGTVAAVEVTTNPSTMQHTFMKVCRSPHGGGRFTTGQLFGEHFTTIGMTLVP